MKPTTRTFHPSSPDALVTRNLLRIVEFGYWVGVVSTAITIVLLVPAVAFGEGLLTLKYALFVVGFLLFGVGSFAIQPSPRGRGPMSRLFAFSVDSEAEFGFEQWLQTLPPLEADPIVLDARVSRNVKVFVTSLVLLGISLFLEVGLGVGPA